jgi:hypothetical protein
VVESVRSLRDLHLLIPRKAHRNARQRRLDAYRARHGLSEAVRGVPFVPCWRCGKTILYPDAVVTTGSSGMGFGHPAGECNPDDVASYADRLHTAPDADVALVWAGPGGRHGTFRVLDS